MVERPTKRVKVQPSLKNSKRATEGSPKPAKKLAVSLKGKERASAGAKATIEAPKHTDSGPSPSALPSTFKVITGSYEKLLYGLEGSTSAEGSNYKFELKPIFIFPAHISSVRAVAASPDGGKWLATGSGDEIIKVWDLRRRKEIGGLMHHEGSITHLEFPSRSYLLSASEDGTLCLFRARDWAVLRSLKGHKGRVNSVAVHPSGKVALSVGKDRTLRMWDLMRGKGSASTKLGKGVCSLESAKEAFTHARTEAEVVRWSTDGARFAVLSQSTIDIYSTEMKLLHSITHPSRLHDVKFCRRVQGEGEVLLVAAEDKIVSVYDMVSDHSVVPTIIAEMIGATNRVKAVDYLSIALPPQSKRQSTTVVSTISSDGKVRLYDLATLPESVKERTQLTPVGEYDTRGSRLTCLTLADGEISKSGIVGDKRKRKDEDEDEAEDDGADESPIHSEQDADSDSEDSEDDEDGDET